MPRKSHHSKDMHIFAARLATLAPGVTHMSNEYKKLVAKRVHERLVMATPVDTSTALSNWQMATVGTGIIQSPIDAFFRGKGGSTEAASISMALVAAAAALKGAPAGFPIAISNVVDYIGDLAYSPYRSPQATGDWVRRAMAVGMRQGMLEAKAKVVW